MIDDAMSKPNNPTPPSHEDGGRGKTGLATICAVTVNLHRRESCSKTLLILGELFCAESLLENYCIVPLAQPWAAVRLCITLPSGLIVIACR